MNKLTILIPSLKQPKQIGFLQKATSSIRNQSIANDFAITILVGVDKNCALDPNICNMLGLSCIESEGHSRAKALNSAIKHIDSEFVAFLEDDDQWMPDYLKFAMHALSFCDFVSSTQAEFNEADEFIRVNDFPTPSGWCMPLDTLKKVGYFNEDFIHHQDSEWLGRLNEKRVRRVHLVESTIDIDEKNIARLRPKLMNVINFSNENYSFMNHHSSDPLVKRLVHTNSGMSLIAADRKHADISRAESSKLKNMFGKIPW